jgi:hypothetical protein
LFYLLPFNSVIFSVWTKIKYNQSFASHEVFLEFV